MSDAGGLRTMPLLGTSLAVTHYDELIRFCQERVRRGGPALAIDFTNTQILTMRRREAPFAQITERIDYFIPDGMPLIWCLNRRGAHLRDRVYGPTFMRRCVLASPAPFSHYFLGASQACLEKLRRFFTEANPAMRVAGAHHGYFQPPDEERIVEEIRRVSPDFIWIGLGTPKQQEWIHRHKSAFARGVLLAVGFAFDVNAGAKPDAPSWMQRAGLTWLFRMWCEPARLGPRYLRYNTLFLLDVLREWRRG